MTARTATTDWTDIALSGTKLKHPIAMVYDLEHDALFVLDRPQQQGAVGLTRIDLGTGYVTDLGLVAAGGKLQAALAIGRLGGLLVAISRDWPAYTRFAKLAIEGDEMRATAWALRPGEVLDGSVYPGRGGVAYLVKRQGGWSIRTLNDSQLVPAPAHGLPCP